MSQRAGVAAPTYTARNGMVFKEPVSVENGNGSTTLHIGFPVCTMHPIVGDEGAETVAALMNIGDRMQWRQITEEVKDGRLVLLGKKGDPDWPVRCRRWENGHWRGGDSEDATHFMPTPLHP